LAFTKDAPDIITQTILDQQKASLDEIIRNLANDSCHLQIRRQAYPSGNTRVAGSEEDSIHEFPQVQQVLARCREGEEVWETLDHNERDAKKAYDKMFSFGRRDDLVYRLGTFGLPIHWPSKQHHWP
jgi:hypothetical protein